MTARVLVGDALTVLRTLPAASVDVVCCDPPYGINTKSDGTDKLSPWADLCNASLWYATWLSECRRTLRENGCLWSFLNWRSMVTFQKAACDTGWPIESLLVWDKEWIGPTQFGLRPSYELVALWKMPGFSIADRAIPDIRRCKWSSHKPSGHPAEKPVALVEWLLDIAGVGKGSTVLDPFCGSGTTGIAARNLGAAFIGCEIDERWAETAKQRIDAVAPLFVRAAQ